MSSTQSPLKPFLILALIGLAAIAAAVAWKRANAKELVPWRTDYAGAVEEARAANKPLFVYFTATWCGPCRTLKHTLWSEADVEAALRDFVPVKVDVDQQRELALRHNVDGIPRFQVQDADGQVFKVSVGAIGVSEFVEWLN